jgi:hypothetical protein
MYEWNPSFSLRDHRTCEGDDSFFKRPQHTISGNEFVVVCIGWSHGLKEAMTPPLHWNLSTRYPRGFHFHSHEDNIWAIAKTVAMFAYTTHAKCIGSCS